MDSIDAARIQATFRSRHWVFDIRPGEQCAPTCGEELKRRLPNISDESWGERFALGGLYLCGREVSPESRLEAPCVLEYFEPLDSPGILTEKYPKFDPESILYHDEDIGVVVKPEGLPTTAPRDQKKYNLQRYLSEHFAAPVHVPSRLDVGVSGVLIFSRSSRMNRSLQKIFTKRSVEKRYLAEVSGEFPHAESNLQGRMARDPRHPVLRRVVESGGDEAHTYVRKLCSYEREGRRYTLLQVEPLTGRTHQIRVHLSSAGFPIVGDPYYGGVESDGIKLLSFALSLYHPYQQRVLSIELPLARWPNWLQTINESYPDWKSEMRGRCDESDKGR